MTCSTRPKGRVGVGQLTVNVHDPVEYNHEQSLHLSSVYLPDQLSNSLATSFRNTGLRHLDMKTKE